MFANIHHFLIIVSPELTLLGVVTGLISIAPIIKERFTHPQRNIFSNSELTESIQQSYESCPLIEIPSLWDRFWLKVFHEASLSIDELFQDGIEGVLIFLLLLAALGWAASANYNRELTIALSLIVLFCVTSTSICLIFLKRYRPTPLGAYIRYLFTAMFSVISIYMIRFKDCVNITGSWILLYFLLRAVGIALIIMPVLLSSGSIIAYARDRVIVFRNDWHYLIYSILSIFICSDICFSLIKALTQHLQSSRPY